jgi:flagellar hook-basal body complex protein FliE
MEITPFKPISLPSIDPTAKTGTTQNPVDNASKTFGQVLNSLNDSQQNADDLLSQLASGGNVDVHQVMLATEENDVNFRVAMAIRDQLVNAYREVMRMAI